MLFEDCLLAFQLLFVNVMKVMTTKHKKSVWIYKSIYSTIILIKYFLVLNTYNIHIPNNVIHVTIVTDLLMIAYVVYKTMTICKRDLILHAIIKRVFEIYILRTELLVYSFPLIYSYSRSFSRYTPQWIASWNVWHFNFTSLVNTLSTSIGVVSSHEVAGNSILKNWKQPNGINWGSFEPRVHKINAQSL